MVPWWGTDSYLNNEQFQISDIAIITSAYGSSGSFGSIVRSKSIVHNTYTFRIGNSHLKTSQFMEQFTNQI